MPDLLEYPKSLFRTTIPFFTSIDKMRPTLSRAFSTSITSKAGAGAKPSGSFVRRTDELAKRHDLSKMSPHAWNDVPAPTHLQLEAERERRHFARLVALDLPQLSRQLPSYSSLGDAG